MKCRTKTDALKAKSTSKFGRIIVLTGARQTGKTTLVKNTFPDYQYLSIEDPVLRLEYTSLTAQQWNGFYPKAILDEVQKEPSLVESIKSVYDQFPETNYILLGSSQLLLLQKVKESLAGRCHIEELFPLSIPEILSNSWTEVPNPSVFQEFIKSNKLPELLSSFQLYPNYFIRQNAFEYYLKFGGYPALVDETINDNDRKDWLKNYVRTYLERDVRDLAEIKNLEPFILVQKASSLLTGQLINFSSLAKEASITPATAQKFIHYLEVSYQTISLPAWHRNQLKRLSKSSKLHYLDPGIQRTIINKFNTDLSGHEFESAIVSELYKQFKNLNFDGTFYHLRTVDGREVDLLIETEIGYYVFEIKQTVNAGISDAKNFKNLDEILDKPILQAFVLSNDPKIKTLAPGIIALPAAMFLS